MKAQIQKLLFKDKGFIPYEWRISFPQNQDDSFLVVFVQWEQGEEWEAIPLRIEVHSV